MPSQSPRPALWGELGHVVSNTDQNPRTDRPTEASAGAFDFSFQGISWRSGVLAETFSLETPPRATGG